MKIPKILVVVSLLKRKIETVPKTDYEMWLDEARKIAPHFKDIPYFALALSLNAAIWSDEKAFKRQIKVKIFSTEKLKTFFYK
ncbi:MAG: hypothetical protein H5T45_05460 [Thermoplasmatales archaeon]|nr:hypothetical protein [Thermoplasmatales archaeon]